MDKKEFRKQKKEALKKIYKKLSDAACELLRNLADDPGNALKHVAVFKTASESFHIQRQLIITQPMPVSNWKTGGEIVSINKGKNT